MVRVGLKFPKVVVMGVMVICSDVSLAMALEESVQPRAPGAEFTVIDRGSSFV
jgi:hypothetical protein